MRESDDTVRYTTAVTVKTDYERRVPEIIEEKEVRKVNMNARYATAKDVMSAHKSWVRLNDQCPTTPATHTNQPIHSTVSSAAADNMKRSVAERLPQERVTGEDHDDERHGKTDEGGVRNICRPRAVVAASTRPI